MKAINLIEPGKLEMVNVPKPEPKEDEVIIRVGAVGVCGSDMRYYQGENPWSLHTLGKDVEHSRSFTLGHEVSGTIFETGEWTDEEKIGERVGVIAFKGCGECYYCRRNMPNLCEETLHIGHDGTWGDVERVPGGYADYMRVWADKAHPIPNNVSFEEATQLDGLAVSVHANEVGGVSPGDDVAVMGTSAIGLMILQVAKTRGAKNIIAIDTWDLPLKLAKTLGADHVINASNVNTVEKVKELTGGLGVNAVFDTAGTKETFNEGVKSLSRKGRYVTLAVTERETNLRMTDIGGEKSIVSSANNKYGDYPVAVDLLASGRVEVEPFVTHVMDLDDYEEAMQMLQNKEEHEAVKIVLIP